MVNIDEKAAQALANSAELVAAVRGIYHDDAPENGCYPLIQYSDITESPALHADNKLYAIQKVIRVTIIDNTNASRHRLKELVYQAMTSAGFYWQLTSTTRDGREYYTSMDFNYGCIN